MKKSLAFALLLAASPLAFTQPSAAQPADQTAQTHGRRGGDRQPGHRVEKMTERLTKKLSLTTEQTAQVHTILTQAGETARQNAQSAADRNGKRAAMKSAMDAADEQIAAILTPAQKDTFTKIRAEQREHQGDRRDRRDN